MCAARTYRNSGRRLKIRIVTTTLGIVWFLGAIVAFFVWSADQNAPKETVQPDFNTLAQEDLKDELLVKGNVGFMFGAYAEEFETTLGFRKSGDSEIIYYIVPVYATNPDGTISPRYCITYKAMPDEFEMMDRLAEQSSHGLSYITPMTVEYAQIEDLPRDVRQFLFEDGFYDGGSFADFCAEYNVFGTADRSIIASKLVPYMLYKTSAPGKSLTFVWVLLGISVFCFTIMLIMTFVKTRIKGIDPPANNEFQQLREIEESDINR